MRQSFVRRARIISGLFLIGAALLLVRLYFLQIVHGSEYRTQALEQYVESSSEALDRGKIFFTSQDKQFVAAAVMQTGWKIAITPTKITDAENLYQKLNNVAPLDHDRFLASAAKKSDPYEEVASRLPDEIAAKIRTLKLGGVALVADRWRLYPAASLAAHVLGFVGFQGDTKAGRYGLERSYEATLSRTGGGLYVNPFAEIFANVSSLLSTDPAAQEGDVITSIEPQVEQHLEDTLSLVMKTYSPRLSGGIIMDPHTGAVVAMAARPTFDPNTFNTAPSTEIFSNPLVESVFEMGSIMKPLTMAAGIDSGAVTPNTTYNDTGCIEKSGKKICNYDGKARGIVSMQEVLNQSLNVGASAIVDKMGQNIFARYVHAYGLGERTGIDLPNEAAGLIHAIDKGSDVDYASASFGQGIAVSPIEMTRALAALANHGALPSPHIVSAIRYESGLSRAITSAAERQVLKPESVDTVTDMLIKVFDGALLHGALKQEHYTIAAKTGTAQIAIPGGGGYYSDRYLHSFFGYFPAHDPKFIVFLFTVEPHGVQFASETLARPFVDIAKFLINYYDIPPDR